MEKFEEEKKRFLEEFVYKDELIKQLKHLTLLPLDMGICVLSVVSLSLTESIHTVNIGVSAILSAMSTTMCIITDSN